MNLDFTSEIFSDPCLVHTRWLQIELPNLAQERLACSLVADLATTATQQATQAGIKQLSISVPTEWNTFSKVLAENNWKKSLRRFTVDPNKRVAVQLDTSEALFSTEKPILADLSPLLMQQAEYHSQRYPAYYRSPSTINMHEYQESITQSLRVLSSFVVCGYHNDTIIAYLQAELFDTQAAVYEMIVDAAHRGRGIGKQLLNRFLNEPAVSSLQISLETWHDQDAQHLYKKFGFEATAQEYYFELE